MVKILNIGILGLGWVARDFMLPAILGSKNLQLVAVCSLALSDMADLPDRVKQFTDIQAFLDVPELEAVYIATPNNCHRKHTVLCLEAGKHVLCEKPMATNAQDALAMCEAAVLSKRVFATAFDQRFHPAHTAARSWVQKGRVGVVTQARIDYACWLPVNWCADNWRVDVVRAGGGAIIDLAPHGLDLLEFIIDTQIVDLKVFDQSLVQSYEVDDGGVLILRFASGALASLHVAYNRPEALPRRRLEIIGTEGSLIAENTMGQDAGGSLIFISAQDGKKVKVDFDSSMLPFALQIENFYEQVVGDSEASRKPSDDLRLFNLLYTSLNSQLEWH